MMTGISTEAGLFELFQAGGFVMYPLLLCSLAIWAVIFERLWKFRKLGSGLRSFHLEAVNAMLRSDRGALESLLDQNAELPTARLLKTAIHQYDARLSEASAGGQGSPERWKESVERKRQLLNRELRANLWILGTVAAAAPFIGLFGTVIGILRSFGDIARTGQGGFAIVAAGISEALIATAAGILVAVVAVMAFNAFQTRWADLVLVIRLHTEEFVEALDEGRLKQRVTHSQETVNGH